MGGYVAKLRPPSAGSPDARGVALLVGTAAWTVLAIAAFFGLLALPYALALVVLPPLVLTAALALSREGRPASLGPAAMWASVVLLALVGSVLVDVRPIVVVVAPAVLMSAIACARYPAAAVVAVFALTGTFNTVEVFTHIPVGETVDLTLAGLWAAAIWNLLVRGHGRTIWIWPGIVASAVYLAITGASVLGAEGFFMGLYGFRVAAWYMAAFVLVAYAGWQPATYRRIAMGILVGAVVVGAYGTFRWIVGPADAELEQALAFNPAYNFVNGELRTFGSFPTGHHLASWTGVVLPFCLAAALTYRGVGRLLGVAAVVLAGLAMLASEVRLAAAAAVAGLAIVIALYQLSRGFRGPHLGTTAVAAVGLVSVGLVLFAVSAGSTENSTERYVSAVTNPTGDPSYKARIFKWETAIADIEQHPLGQGLGTAGEARLKYGRFANIGSNGVDNSYLLIALNQGFAVMAVFIATMLLLFLGLARRAVLATDPYAAGFGIAACGTLVSFSVLFAGGTYIEGLPALAGWLIVGLGAAQFAHRRDEAVS